jgi:hypothetical protein
MEGMATAVWIAKAAAMEGTRVCRKGLRKFVRCKKVLVRVMSHGCAEMDDKTALKIGIEKI